MNTNTTTKGQTMYRIKDAQTGTTLAERTSAENVLSWLEAQGETISTATGLLETAKLWRLYLHVQENCHHYWGEK